MENLTILKGIKVYLNLLKSYDLSINDLLVFSILNYCSLKNNTKISLSKSNLIKLIPLSKDTIKTSLKKLIELKLIKPLSNDYFNVSFKINSLDENDNFIFISTEILYNKDLNTIDKLFLSYIKAFNDSGKEFNFTDKLLSKKLNVSERTTKLTLKRLRNLNFINSKTNYVEHTRTITINNLEHDSSDLTNLNITLHYNNKTINFDKFKDTDKNKLIFIRDILNKEINEA